MSSTRRGSGSSPRRRGSARGSRAPDRRPPCSACAPRLTAPTRSGRIRYGVHEDSNERPTWSERSISSSRRRDGAVSVGRLLHRRKHRIHLALPAVYPVGPLATQRDPDRDPPARSGESVVDLSAGRLPGTPRRGNGCAVAGPARTGTVRNQLQRSPYGGRLCAAVQRRPGAIRHASPRRRVRAGGRLRGALRFLVRRRSGRHGADERALLAGLAHTALFQRADRADPGAGDPHSGHRPLELVARPSTASPHRDGVAGSWFRGGRHRHLDRTRIRSGRHSRLTLYTAGAASAVHPVGDRALRT